MPPLHLQLILTVINIQLNKKTVGDWLGHIPHLYQVIVRTPFDEESQLCNVNVKDTFIMSFLSFPLWLFLQEIVKLPLSV